MADQFCKWAYLGFEGDLLDNNIEILRTALAGEVVRPPFACQELGLSPEPWVAIVQDSRQPEGGTSINISKVPTCGIQNTNDVIVARQSLELYPHDGPVLAQDHRLPAGRRYLMGVHLRAI